MANEVEDGDLFRVDWDLERDTIQDFVDAIRFKVGENSPRKWRGKPVIYSLSNEVKLWSMYLKTNNSELRVRGRIDDLYAVGFLANGTWYAFSDAVDFVPSSKDLHVQSNYCSLLKEAKKDYVHEVIVSTETLKNAIDELARYNPQMTKPAILAKCFLTIILFTCEAARFNSIYEGASEILKPDSSYNSFKPVHSDLIRDWSMICTAMLTNSFDKLTCHGIHSIEDGLAEVAIIKKANGIEVPELDMSDEKEGDGGRGGGGGGDNESGKGGSASAQNPKEGYSGPGPSRSRKSSSSSGSCSSRQFNSEKQKQVSCSWSNIALTTLMGEASMVLLIFIKYKDHVFAHQQGEVIISDQSTEKLDPQRDAECVGIIRDFRIALKTKNLKGVRFILFRVGMGEVKLCHISLGMVAIRKVKDNSRLFSEVNGRFNMADKFRNILAGTAVKKDICCTLELSYISAFFYVFRVPVKDQ